MAFDFPRGKYRMTTPRGRGPTRPRPRSFLSLRLDVGVLSGFLTADQDVPGLAKILTVQSGDGVCDRIEQDRVIDQGDFQFP